jgi:hypothetical protein
MNKKQLNKLFSIGIACLLLIASLFSTAKPYDVKALQSDTINLFLPLVTKIYPPAPTTFGVEMRVVNASHGSEKASEAGVYFVRMSAFSWQNIEPVNTVPQNYNWSSVDEASLIEASIRNMKVIAKVQYTPSWARKFPAYACGPVAQVQFSEFAQFLSTLVGRYGAPPYNVKYWEIGNEPDVDPSLVSPDSVFGCWGDQNDDYYGGGYYADMLKVVYPAIKAADPQAQVLIGGLLMDCDPIHPPAGNDCKPSKFFEGILRNGGASYFDIVNFHGYPPYNGTLQQDEHFPSWEAMGGVVLGKVNFLKEIMSKYGVNKPIMHTEGSLICPEWDTAHCNPSGSAFNEAQADYAVWLFVRNLANGLAGTIWYEFEGAAGGWRDSGMLDENQNPKPVYNAFKFMVQELRDAVYAKQITQYPNLRVYEFSGTGKRIWVLWAPDEKSYTISKPAGTLKILDKYGTNIISSESTITVKSPIYIELTP